MSAISSSVRFVRSGLHELWTRPLSQVPALDALRTLAILGVVGGHYAANPLPNPDGGTLPAPNLALFRFGWTGVDLFFVLSGFLIGKQIWREMQKTGSVQTGRFLLRRGLRIWPLYFFMLAFQFAFFPEFPLRWSDFTFLSNYFPGGLGGGWTLSVEEQFYIAVPILLYITRRSIPLGRYVWLLAVTVLLVPFTRALEVHALHGQGFDSKQIEQMLHAQFHLHSEALLLGLIISLLATIRPEWFKRTANDGFSKVGAAIFFAAIVLGVAVRQINKDSFALTGIAFVYAGMTVFVLLDRSWVTRPLNAWIFYLISRLSYGMYLNHFVCLHFAALWSRSALRHVTSRGLVLHTGGVLLTTIFSMIFATVTFVLIEHPFLMLREHWLERRATAASAVPALAAASAEP